MNSHANTRLLVPSWVPWYKLTRPKITLDVCRVKQTKTSIFLKFHKYTAECQYALGFSECVTLICDL